MKNFVTKILSEQKRFSLLLIVPALFAFTATNDYRFESEENAFSMEVYRVQEKVNVRLNFLEAQKVHYVKIERSSEASSGFEVINYVILSGQKKDVSIVKRDNTPLTFSADAYYRVRVMFDDEIERTFPAVRLPSLAKPEIPAQEDAQTSR